ncbi:heat shock protein HtpX [Planctomycetes bacterium Pan216]|uniref:Heat shock protein HtpX n=1 Tax=Kolteria novifilia TaxID=2527975 RepID=A0A518B255_9BACT|nr:heat shock protein HtpX [Planctomycetes bacterium Pan216]
MDFGKLGVTRNFVLPALCIFLVPVISLLFFLHAQQQLNARYREAILKQIANDPTLNEEQRHEATAFHRAIPLSRLILQDEVAKSFDAETRFHFATFRWAIRLSIWSIAAGVLVLALAGVCVLFSMRSQRALALSLAVGWHVLRIYTAIQVLVQGVLLVALSFWVTALWFNLYSVKLIGLTALLAVVAAGTLIKGIFTVPKFSAEVEGEIFPKNHGAPIWKELESICATLGTEPPDQIIAGIDDNFFVTDAPLTVNGERYQGRTLYISLSLLKQLDGDEAKAVLAHEMAHFSGMDTLYGGKISRLEHRYDHYLQTLYEGGTTIPIFYFLNVFRFLFALSLGKHSRQREFRADGIAADVVSPQSNAKALLRVSAYSAYRGNVEQEVFDQESVLESTNLREKIEQGFAPFAQQFLSSADLDHIETAHPFDTHPPIADRLTAMGVSLRDRETTALLETKGDGKWYELIAGASEIESNLWRSYEERFLKVHEQSLPYRFLPENDAEREIVERAFPKMEFSCKKGLITIDDQSIAFAEWQDKLPWSDVGNCVLDDGTLKIHRESTAGGDLQIKMQWFRAAAERQQFLETFEKYLGRYKIAAEFQEQKCRQREEDSSAE